MDAISYSYADKAHKRIKKIINDPDSTSGVVTIPSTIASGETITIPAGRTAILPNVQIDGTLNVEGTVFIPTGSKMSQVIPRVTSTDNAIVRFDGTNGDVQNSSIKVDDNGFITSNVSTSGEHIFKPSTTAQYTRISAASSDYSSLPSWSSTFIEYNGSNVAGNFVTGVPNAGLSRIWGQNISNMIIGNNSNAPLIFVNSTIEKMRIDAAGNVLVTGSGGLGYGTGSGGTVTQPPTNGKATAVTLNKPTGQIIMNNAALAAGVSISFSFINSLIANTDILVLSLKNGSGSVNAYKLFGECANRSGVIQVTNISGISLAEAIVINYAIIKGAIS